MSSKDLKMQSSFKTKRQAPLGKTDLIHIHKSPNYCVEDPKKGILGTSGRVCNKNSTGSDSCDLLCCGRGYNTQVINHDNSIYKNIQNPKWFMIRLFYQQVVRHVERCFCRFVWCCQVKCKTCVTMVDVHTCKWRAIVRNHLIDTRSLFWLPSFILYPDYFDYVINHSPALRSPSSVLYPLTLPFPSNPLPLWPSSL